MLFDLLEEFFCCFGAYAAFFEQVNDELRNAYHSKVLPYPDLPFSIFKNGTQLWLLD
jgi:hypothetical protein